MTSFMARSVSPCHHDRSRRVRGIMRLLCLQSLSIALEFFLISIIYKAKPVDGFIIQKLNFWSIRNTHDPCLLPNGDGSQRTKANEYRGWAQQQRHTKSMVEGGFRTMLSGHTIRFESHVSTHPEPQRALQKVLEDSAPNPSICLLFVGSYHAESFAELALALHRAHPNRNTPTLALVGAGVVGDSKELDEPTSPSLSLLCGYGLEDLGVGTLFSFNALTKPPPSPDSIYWEDLVFDSHTTTSGATTTDSTPSVFLVGDPWSPIDHVLQGLQECVIMGGISVPSGTGPTVAMNGQALSQGSLVGWRLPARLQLQVVTAQGCRPVNHSQQTYRITDCRQNVILELDGQPATEVLESLIKNASSDEERRKISSGLVVGLGVCGRNAGKGLLSVPPEENDDFLIRQIAGFIPQSKGILIAAGGKKLTKGDEMQFFVRDEKAARQDLQLMVQRAQASQLFHASPRPVAALQVSCVARGRYLYNGTPHVDLSQYQSLLLSSQGGNVTSDVAVVGGFYANGEIGGVGLAGFDRRPREDGQHPKTYIHGFTTVVGLLCPVESSTDRLDALSQGTTVERQDSTPSSDGIVMSSDGSRANSSWE